MCLAVLDVLPGGFAEVETDYVVVGLHTRGDGAESGVVDGGDAGDAVLLSVSLQGLRWANPNEV